MAAVSTSPPPLSTSPNGENREHASARPYSSKGNSSDEQPRLPLSLPSLNVGNARLRDGPVSPVKVNFQNENWAQPSNANIELAQPQAAHFHIPHDSATTVDSPDTSHGSSGLSSRKPVQPFQASTVGSEQHNVNALASRFSHAALNPGISTVSAVEPERYESSATMSPTAISPTHRVRNQDVYRTSRESDETGSSSQKQASAQSSAATSASSVSGINDNSECTPNGDSPGSSILEGNIPRNMSVPQFQYHHHPDYPTRVSSVPGEVPRAYSNSDLLDSAGHIRRHLTPTTGYMRRSSLPRPQSSYSTLSDYSPRGRSPNLMPGGSQMRAPSVQSRKSPDVRMSTYSELLNVPYPQQAPPALSLDNSNLRNVIGNNASLLSTQKTLEMYRQNVKKTTDFSIQYSFAVFLISSAQDQGVDVSDPKARKSTVAQPLRDLDSPIVEGSVASPYELVREARQILQRLANGGYPFAQYYLADGYASGLFSKGKEDYNSAFPLFVLAAKHGHAESAYRTALCYEFGWGCRKDPAKAVQFLRTAAAKRHPGAMTRLGKACLSGDLGEKRYREGIKWLKLAAESADSQYNAAPYQLGCLYETGYGDDVFADESYAAELFTQAADLGHPEANFRMGDAYEHGLLNCPKDPALSVHFYTGAAERGHAAAMMGLCAWYMVGAPPILDKDEEEAYEWARRSAELGK